MGYSMKEAQVLNIQHFCLHDGPGIRTTVFLKGCPLSCLWCSNPTTQKMANEIGFEESKCFSCAVCVESCAKKAITFSQENFPIIDREVCDHCGECVRKCKGRALTMLGKQYDIKTLYKEVEKDSSIYRNSGGGVTLSGGEVLMQAEFSQAFLNYCRNNGLHTAIETSAFASFDKLLAVAKEADCIMVDIKVMDEEVHKKATGVGNKIIIENIQKLTKIFPETCVRIPLIPSINTHDNHIIDLALFTDGLANNKVELLPYHPLGANKYKTIGKSYDLPLTRMDDDEVKHIVELFRTHAKCKEVICTV